MLRSISIFCQSIKRRLQIFLHSLQLGQVGFHFLFNWYQGLLQLLCLLCYLLLKESDLTHSLVDEAFEALNYFGIERVIWLQVDYFLSWFVEGFFIELLCLNSQGDRVDKFVDDFEVGQVVGEYLVNFWKYLVHKNM